MFKKPLSNIKTSAPLRSSDRRKLKQRVVTAYQISPEDGDLLVPDGIMSTKFSTHVDEHGVAYIDPEGNPLWFTIGKGNDELVPSVYTLWKKQDLLPFLTTPSAVIPILVGGADLMIPGVMSCPPSLRETQIVSIRQYSRKDGSPVLSAPLAVGRMALSSNQICSGSKEKGKAVLVWHTWKDHLWDMGSKVDPPADSVITAESPVVDDASSEDGSADNDGAKLAETATALTLDESPDVAKDGPSSETSAITYSPQEVSEILNKTLVHSIQTSLSALPASSFPIPATLFYQNYILPSRPAFPTLVHPPASLPVSQSSNQAPTVDTDITIKTSSHKSLTAFLKAAEKASLIGLKPPHKQQPDVLITSVNSSHPSVASQPPFVTVRDIEAKAAKRVAREEKQAAQANSKEIEVTELWKPHQVSVDIIEGMGGSKNDLYAITDVRALLNAYIASHNLVNTRDQAYINLDDLLYNNLATKSKGKSKKNESADDDAGSLPQFMKRDELTKHIMDKMQNWYQIKAANHETVTKKGALSPIQVTMKMRQGRKACTLITGFEPFQVFPAEDMAEDLRKACAGATSVSPIPGKPAGAGMEVLVQGKQSKIVVDYLLAKGMPKKWIQVTDMSGKK
ncbi:eukaryotic translation initiation factor SUI1 family protein [Panaeolus papilionaceus]|nr:eukaryotic translation initiation factor SUI1 family protein [Panaeolus papilionaceus]